MFTELMPLLKQRVLVLTISRVDDALICVSVIPKKRDTATDDNSALTMPLSFTGRPDELDRELPAQLAGFVESVIRTGSNLDELKVQHAAAVKAVEAENRKRLDEKKKVNGKSAPPSEKPDNSPEFKDGKPVFGTKASSEPGATASLFDTVETPESPADAMTGHAAGQS
jgi:PRTRC genetic system protein E